MATSTQFNPNADLNRVLLAAGASKTVYALVTPETERAKAAVFGDADGPRRQAYLDQFREAWTAKQDRIHEDFFHSWHGWSAPVVDLDRKLFPFHYPTAGASEALRHLIYDFSRRYTRTMAPPLIHVFEGEYEGYKAMAEAAGVEIMEWSRDDWRLLVERLNYGQMGWNHLVFLSQPSAIDGNVWKDCNEFLASITMPNCVVMDVTYVGAIPEGAVNERFNLNLPCVRNVVFSLSKPFGLYYDRVGGVFCREEDMGLFGNKWFKNLTSLSLGTIMMERSDVFAMATKYAEQQKLAVAMISARLGFTLTPSDVFILATAESAPDAAMDTYLRRPATGKLRLCLTPDMAKQIGTV